VPKWHVLAASNRNLLEQKIWFICVVQTTLIYVLDVFVDFRRW